MIHIRRDMGCFGTKSRSIWLRVFKSSSLHQIWDTRPEVYDFDQIHQKWATRLVMGVSFDLLNGGVPNSLFDKNVEVNSEFGKKSANSVKCVGIPRSGCNLWCTKHGK